MLPQHCIFESKYIQHGSSDHNASVVRYGLNSKLFDYLDGLNSSHGILHPAEFITIFQAMESLSKRGYPGSDVYFDYKYNVVVCDIFDRGSEKESKFQKEEDGRIKTHSVVLWKITDKKVVIIDPNDQKFCKFIDKLRVKSDTELAVLYDILPKDADYTLPNDTKFYSSGEGSGAAHGTSLHHTRDCVDIAVKIAFFIDEAQKTYQRVDLILRDLYKYMSTNSDGETFSKLKLAREAHSSNLKTRESFSIILDFVSKVPFMNKELCQNIFNNKIYKK